MREPYDDLDADGEERAITQRRERAASPICVCGEPKEPGKMRCLACEEWEMREMVRLNPPTE